MKLYRGLKTPEFSMFDHKTQAGAQEKWSGLLQLRARGDFKYPMALDREILLLAKVIRLQRQYFTDRKEIARSYAKTNGGALVEIDVPQKDILRQFSLEFQNFGLRKNQFEIVYAIDAHLLVQNRKKWKLRVRQF